MVEFGLKLEDNKVDKWSTKYLDYEKLKAILKRAKSGLEYRDELIARMPAAVLAEVSQERKSRAAGSASSLVSGVSGGAGGGQRVEWGPLSMRGSPLRHSSSSLPATLSAAEDEDDKQDKKDKAPINDSTPLLPSKNNNNTMTRENSFSSLSHLSNINKTVFKVTSYLGFASEKAMLLQAYDDADDKLALFQRTYNEEVTKVKEFYEHKLRDVSERMEALRADTSFLEEKAAKKKQEMERLARLRARRGSIIEGMKQQFSNFVSHNLINDGDVVGDSEEGVAILQSITSESYDETPTKINKSGGPGKGGGGDVESLRRKLDLDSIKRAMDDIYRTAKLLHNFSIMNYTGFVKIAKKFDKTVKEHKGLFKGNNCDDGKQAEVIAAKMERMYADWFCDGDMREAQAKMLSKRGDGLMMDWTQLRLGYRLGMCSILALWVAWDCVWGQLARGQVSIGGRTAFPVFRGCFGLLAWHWFWGLSVYVWSRFRVNYIYLFEFDPRNVDAAIDIFNYAVDETLVFLICMLLYYKTGSDEQLFPGLIPPGAYPMFLILYTIKCLIFPWKFRKPMWVAIRQVLLASFVSPTFFLTYVGDVFTR
jgi:hypothetical protein